MKNKQARRGSNQSVPVTFQGQASSVRLSDIAARKWVEAHGTTIGGTQVNSAAFVQIGDSTIIQGDAGPTLSMPSADAELLAVTMAKAFGYTVTAPAA